MIYDDDTSQRVHLSLPLEDLREMAARMTRQPTSRVAEAIVRAVKRRAEGTNRPKVSPSRVKSDLSFAGIEVSVEQVAWVMLTATGSRRRRWRAQLTFLTILAVAVFLLYLGSR